MAAPLVEACAAATPLRGGLEARGCPIARWPAARYLRASAGSASACRGATPHRPLTRWPASSHPALQASTHANLACTPHARRTHAARTTHVRAAQLRRTHTPGAFHAVFTTHRDARDALLALAQTVDGGHGAAGCTARLLGRFREYAHFAPHACRDMRYEDIVHGGHGAQARRACAVHGPCVPCVQCACSARAVGVPWACRVRALCVHPACTLRAPCAWTSACRRGGSCASSGCRPSST